MFIKPFDKKKSDPAHKLKLIVDIGINEQKIKYNARALLEDNVCLLGCDGFANDSFDRIESEEDLINYLIATIDAVYTEASKLFLSARKTEEKMEELRAFIARFSANASKSKQATSRRNMLDKLSLEDIKPSSRKYPAIRFNFPHTHGKENLKIEKLNKTVDGQLLIKNFNLDV